MKPQYGFEHKGHEAIGNVVAVPPNATLMVSLELVSWKVIDEIIDDKKVLKKILKQGDGYEKPNDGAVVKVKYTGKLEDGTIFEEKGSYEDPFEFMIGEEQVVDGLDRVVMTMKKEEGNALFKVGKYFRASKKYDKATKYIEHDTSFSE